jgi:hypothetical protein
MATARRRRALAVDDAVGLLAPAAWPTSPSSTAPPRRDHRAVIDAEPDDVAS